MSSWTTAIDLSAATSAISLGVAAFRSEARTKKINRIVVANLKWSASIAPLMFEKNCAEFLKLIGWSAELTKASGDQGADIIAWKEGVKVVCQCKKYSKAVGNKAVQEAFAAKQYYKANAGAVITNAKFTRSAMDLATATDIKLFHFQELLKFNSIITKGGRDVDPATFSPGQIGSSDTFEAIQHILYAISGLSAIGLLISILSVCGGFR